MIYGNRKGEQVKDPFLTFYSKFQKLLSDEKGQTLVEYSLLLGISSALSGAIATFLDHPFIAIVMLVVLFYFVPFWKPKVLAIVVFVALLLLVILFIYRWAQYGHI